MLSVYCIFANTFHGIIYLNIVYKSVKNILYSTLLLPNIKGQSSKAKSSPAISICHLP